MSLLLALLFSALGLLTTAEGTRAIHQADYQRCLANIARLETEVGIVPAPTTKPTYATALRGATPSLSATYAKWTEATPVPKLSRRERDILARAHNGQGATPAELAYLSECAAKRYLARR